MLSGLQIPRSDVSNPQLFARVKEKKDKVSRGPPPRSWRRRQVGRVDALALFNRRRLPSSYRRLPSSYLGKYIQIFRATELVATASQI